MTIPGEGLPRGPETDIEGDEDAGEEGIVDPDAAPPGPPSTDEGPEPGPAEGDPAS